MTQRRPYIICEPGLCSVSRSKNFYKTSHRMMVFLLAGGVQTKKDKHSINFHLNFSVVYILLVRRCTYAIKLTTAHCFFFFFFFFALNAFLSERRNFSDNKIST